MIHDVPLPRTGSTSTDFATVVSWYVEIGDTVSVGDPVAEVETDKSVVDVESTVAGTVRERCLAESEELEIGEVLLRVDDGDGPAEPASAPATGATAGDTGGPPSAPPSAPTVDEDASAQTPTRTSTSGGGRRPTRATPAARRRARELGLELAALAPGTGPLGRVEVEDVESAARPPATTGGDDDWAAGLTGARRIIGTRMAEAARQTAPVTLYRDLDVTRVSRWIEGRDATRPAGVLDVVLAVLARTLRSTPEVNAHLTRDGLASSEAVHLGYAVDGPRGLVVPVVRDADAMDLDALSTTRREVVSVALAGRLAGEDMEGATFTVSNLGPLGVERFGPIVNLPQVAILGLGTIRQAFVVGAGGEPVVRTLLGVGLTFDHRAVDGAPAARFLDDVARRLHEPLELLS